ncbi:MAG: hypothetical protein HYX71_08490 [Opitutae bacterium]|nr:hypothetical protein [Opitutae bacterium]
MALLLLPVLAGFAAPVPALAVTHSELLGDPEMNPKRFANHFAHFRYEYHASVQPVDAFLRSERGDCDDYAILADEVLRRRQFQTFLVHVRLAGMTAHAVCYVEQNRAYLDYNNRNVFFTLSKSGASLREIAAKVADSLEAGWTSASIFTYSYATRKKQMIQTIARTDPPALDAVGRGVPASRLLVN